MVHALRTVQDEHVDADPMFTFPTVWERIRDGALRVVAVPVGLLALILVPAVPALVIAAVLSGGWSLLALLFLPAATAGAVMLSDTAKIRHMEQRQVRLRTIPLAVCVLALCAVPALPAGRDLATAAWHDIGSAAPFLPTDSCSDVSGLRHPCE